MSEWIKCSERMPDKREPVVYMRPSDWQRGKIHVGIAYWTVSEKWNPECESTQAPEGFTHWIPLPEPPQES